MRSIGNRNHLNSHPYLLNSCFHNSKKIKRGQIGGHIWGQFESNGIELNLNLQTVQERV
jgi:hypothetical protein